MRGWGECSKIYFTWTDLCLMAWRACAIAAKKSVSAYVWTWKRISYALTGQDKEYFGGYIFYRPTFRHCFAQRLSLVRKREKKQSFFRYRKRLSLYRRFVRGRIYHEGPLSEEIRLLRNSYLTSFCNSPGGKVYLWQTQP